MIYKYKQPWPAMRQHGSLLYPSQHSSSPTAGGRGGVRDHSLSEVEEEKGRGFLLDPLLIKMLNLRATAADYHLPRGHVIWTEAL